VDIEIIYNIDIGTYLDFTLLRDVRNLILSKHICTRYPKGWWSWFPQWWWEHDR